jgi:hypothetical protein
MAPLGGHVTDAKDLPAGRHHAVPQERCSRWLRRQTWNGTAGVLQLPDTGDASRQKPLPCSQHADEGSCRSRRSRVSFGIGLD